MVYLEYRAGASRQPPYREVGPSDDNWTMRRCKRATCVSIYCTATPKDRGSDGWHVANTWTSVLIK